MSIMKKERYFASGLAGAILALWAVSSFAYFSNSIAPSNAIASESLNIDATAKVASEEQLMRIIDQSHTRDIFLPLGGNNLNIPGSKCNITENNLGLYYEFKGVPEDCFKVLGSE